MISQQQIEVIAKQIRLEVPTYQEERLNKVKNISCGQNDEDVVRMNLGPLEYIVIQHEDQRYLWFTVEKNNGDYQYWVIDKLDLCQSLHS